jgi:3-mercaptopyruvate sulfurtransferase SseA
MRSSLLDYLKGHIPNAIYLHFENLQVPQDGTPAQSPDRICLERLIWDALSLSNDMWVIL